MERAQQCLPLIESYYPELNATEQKIADYILAAPENIMNKPITQVAEEIGVASSTIFRFCQRLGFTGYQKLKIALASDIAAPIRERVQDKIEELDNERAVTETIFQTSIRTFQDTIQTMDFSLIKQAVQLLLGAEKIEFYGTGNSGIVALDAHHKFTGSGLFTVAYTDAYLQRRAAAQLSEHDVAFIISGSDAHEEAVAVFEAAEAAGAKTIVMTNLMRSPMNNRADIMLRTAASGMASRTDDMHARIVQMSLIDALYTNAMKTKTSRSKKSGGLFKKWIDG